ncbi:hypothetical protein M747DRAFT_57037 [Aspergillus niger ATCC 13496]|uniref:Uncharacterized protein n=1 Tax=Aspergillus niger ATCC 13496 TaxID=1353008 RepID=A0A370CE26_ASPNG|nr:hypothetical protein M747DRAFT_57037 [Aspergillus niger ATCC 13496]
MIRPSSTACRLVDQPSNHQLIAMSPPRRLMDALHLLGSLLMCDPASSRWDSHFTLTGNSLDGNKFRYSVPDCSVPLPPNPATFSWFHPSPPVCSYR